jgi:hypothetical protein
MARCSGIKADGGRCGAQAIRGAEHCVNHHPDYEHTRRRRNSKGGKRGGRGRPQVELANIKAQLQTLANDVLDGEVDRANAAVASQILNVLLRAITIELQVKEHLEFQERLEAVEAALSQRKGGPYGA